MATAIDREHYPSRPRPRATVAEFERGNFDAALVPLHRFDAYRAEHRDTRLGLRILIPDRLQIGFVGLQRRQVVPTSTPRSRDAIGRRDRRARAESRHDLSAASNAQCSGTRLAHRFEATLTRRRLRERSGGRISGSTTHNQASTPVFICLVSSRFARGERSYLASDFCSCLGSIEAQPLARPTAIWRVLGAVAMYFAAKVLRRRSSTLKPIKATSEQIGGNMPELTINGRREVVDAPGNTPLLWIIREQLQMTGTKFGCGGGFRGALHRACRRGRRSLVPNSSCGHRRQVRHDDRRPERTRRSSVAERPGSPSRCRSADIANPARSCRLLHCWRRTRHARRNRRRDERQSLSSHYLSPDRESDRTRGDRFARVQRRPRRREEGMTKHQKISSGATALSRRSFRRRRRRCGPGVRHGRHSRCKAPPRRPRLRAQRLVFDFSRLLPTGSTNSMPRSICSR